MVVRWVDSRLVARSSRSDVVDDDLCSVVADEEADDEAEVRGVEGVAVVLVRGVEGVVVVLVRGVEVDVAGRGVLVVAGLFCLPFTKSSISLLCVTVTVPCPCLFCCSCSVYCALAVVVAQTRINNVATICFMT